MKNEMIGIKRFLPFVLFAVALVGYLFGQLVFDLGDPRAKLSGKEKKINAHFEAMFKKANFKNLEGKELNLKKEKAPIVILNFWASWCQPCLEEFPSLNKLRKKYDHEDLKIIGINTDVEDQTKSIAKIKKKYNLNFDIVADKKGKIISDFMVEAIPVSVIFKNGKVFEITNGKKDFFSEEVQDQFNTILAKKK